MRARARPTRRDAIHEGAGLGLAVASQQLEHWKAQIRQGTYVPDADQTRFDALATLLIDEYQANGRKSVGRAEAAVDHLKRCPAPATATGRQRHH